MAPADALVLAIGDGLGRGLRGVKRLRVGLAEGRIPEELEVTGGGDPLVETLEAVVDRESGRVVRDPADASAAADAIAALLRDQGLRNRMAHAGRRRAVADFSYDNLAERLAEAIDAMVIS